MTVRFFLVRHGRAEGHHPGGDAARRLVPEGAAAFAALARALAPDLKVTRIAASPLARAAETAALLAAATGAPVEEEAALGPGASDGRALLSLGLALGDGAALVGHNPELAEAGALAAGRDVEVPPGTVAAVDAGGGSCRLAWLRRPP
jgi:phosphohistidine phosphatase